MKPRDYYQNVLVPANVAVSRIRMAGLPVDTKRVEKYLNDWGGQISELERDLSAEAARRGVPLSFSAAHQPQEEALVRILYGNPSKNEGNKKWKWSGGILKHDPKQDTKKTLKNGAPVPSTDSSVLSKVAVLSGVPREDGKPDDPWVLKLMKVRSLSKASSTYLRAFASSVRADGCVHPKFNWSIVRTARLSIEDPPMHQIPESSDPEVSQGVKSCLIARVNPVPDPKDWDPRKHGSVFRWDISGAEAAIRAAMLTHRFCSSPEVLWEYIRKGKDVHGRTAAMIYGKPEGTYKKGDRERDAVGKQCFFAKLFLGTWRTIQQTVWKKARIWLPDEEAQRISEAFDAAYPRLVELGHRDCNQLGRYKFVEDGYGRRRYLGLPPGVEWRGEKADGSPNWSIKAESDSQRSQIRAALAGKEHQAANSPTQSMNATDTLWMLALMLHGEETTPLAVPAMWKPENGGDGILFPEAAGWKLHGGPGPGGKPFQAWHTNTVHDSGWGDCAPGYLEPVAKLVFRRCTAVPFDWRLEADVPYRVELKCGPDFAHLYGYNKVAKEFGFEPVPEDRS